MNTMCLYDGSIGRVLMSITSTLCMTSEVVPLGRLNAAIRYLVSVSRF